MRFLALSLSLLLCAIAPNFAAAQQAMPDAPQVTATLTSPQTATGTESTVPLLLTFALPEGWHTYWRSPGIAGAPPQLDWKNSQNLKSATIQWPAPTRFSQQGLETFGYEGTFALPLTATLDKAGDALDLKLSADLVVCNEICVPAHATASLSLPAGASKPSHDAAAWQTARDLVPQDLNSARVILNNLELKTDTTPPAVILTASRVGGWSNPDVIAEAGDAVFNKPTANIEGEKAIFTLPLDTADDAAALPGHVITLTFLNDSARAAEGATTINGIAATETTATKVEETEAPADAPVEMAQAHRSLWTLLLISLLGGLVLNLMPCVLPVLSLKLLSVVQHAGETKARIRAGFLTTASGILVSFWMLAAAATGLQLAGHSVGWGVQFQQPLFLAFLYAIVLAFAANLWGWFEIALPWRWQNKLGGPQTVGEIPSLTQEFATGLVATLLATPCTAPFVGTAVGFALAGSTVETFSIFTALGLGLASPYLLIALFPALARKLPRPGKWMAPLRVVLGCALLATAFWLLGLLEVQLGLHSTLGLVAGGGVLLLALKRRFLWASLALLVVLTLSPLALPADPVMMDEGTPSTKMSWQKFAPDQIAPLVESGKTVFVDLTATWCLTCHANETFVLNTPEITAALSKPDIVLMRGDWTRPDPVIAKFLMDRQRAGIPFNMIVTPHNPAGTILPELLTKDAVLKALEQ